MAKNTIMFRLKREWETPDGTTDLWKDILEGRKTEEFRDATPYWISRIFNIKATSPRLAKLRLLTSNYRIVVIRQGDPSFVIPKIAVFTVGFPKNNVPRIEAEIVAVVYYKKTKQIGTRFKNPVLIDSAKNIRRRKREVLGKLKQKGYSPSQIKRLSKLSLEELVAFHNDHRGVSD